MKKILIFTCFFTLAGCHSVINEKTEQLDSALSALQYLNSPPLNKEISVFLSEDKNTVEKNRILIKLHNVLNESLYVSEKCFELAENSVKTAMVAESYSDVAGCTEALFNNKEYLYSVKLLSDLSDNEHLLQQDDSKKLNLLFDIYDKINMNIMYINSVGSLAIAEKSATVILSILANYERGADKTGKLEDAMASALNSVKKAKNRVRKAKEMREKILFNL